MMYEVNGKEGTYEEQRTNQRQDEQPWTSAEKMSVQGSFTMRTSGNKKEKEKQAEDIYIILDEHMQKALCFHEQLADYFCFLGLQGFKRKLEYQYMEECAEKRKLHHKYINLHQKLIPLRQVQVPQMIPRDWSKYTTNDVNDNVLPKFVKSAMEQYKEWEEETKELYEEQWQKCISYGMTADAEYISDLVEDVTKELKKINRMCEQLNGTGYEATAIHNMQDKYHEKYKDKYREKYTNRETKQMKGWKNKGKNK